MTTTAVNQIDFTYRYNTVFFSKDDHYSAIGLYNAASESIDGSYVFSKPNELGIGIYFRACGSDGARSVSLGRSLNGRWYVSMNNIDAPLKDER